MRKTLGVAVVVSMVAMFSLTALAGNYGDYRDEFRNGGYSGSVGSFDWSNDPWKEIGDNGSPSSGAVHVDGEGDCVSSQCLHIFSEGDPLDGVGAKRHADTSVFTEFDLCYEVRYEGYAETEAYLVVEKSVDGGSKWYQLQKFDLSEPFTAHPTHYIGQYDSMKVRFLVYGDMVGEVFIDDVELKGEIATTSTTSTSTTSTSTTSTTIENSTTTTVKESTTTTKHREETTTSTSQPDETTSSTSSTTTTTVDETTSTTEAIVVIPGSEPPNSSGGAPDGSGIRESARGIQADFDSALFGDVPLFSSAYVDHNANYSMAAEVIKASWAWLLVLAVIMGWSIVSGLERRRSISES